MTAAEDWLIRGREVNDDVREFVAESRKVFDKKQNQEHARELLLKAQSLLKRGPESMNAASLLAAESAEMSPSLEAVDILRSCLRFLPELVAELPHDRPPQRLAFSRDSKLLATETWQEMKPEEHHQYLWDIEQRINLGGDNAGTILGAESRYSRNGSYRWDFDSEKSTLTVSSSEARQAVLVLPVDINSGSAGEQCFRFSSDATKMAVGQQSSVSVWELSTRTRIFHLDIGSLRRPGRTSAHCSSVALSPDNDTVVFAVGNQVHFRSLSTGEQIRMITHSSTISLLHFDESGHRLAIGGDNGCCNIWNADGEELSRIVHRLGLPVVRVAFSPSGGLLATVADIVYAIDDTVRVWAPESGREVEFSPIVERVDACVFGPQGHYALANDAHRVQFVAFDNHSRKCLTISEKIKKVFDLNDQRHVCLLADGKLSLWDVEEGWRLWSVSGIVDAAVGMTHYAVTLREPLRRASSNVGRRGCASMGGGA